MDAAHLKAAQRAYRQARRAKGYVWVAYFDYQSWRALFLAVADV